MNFWLNLLNAGAVGLFGIILSVSFCDIKWTKEKKIIFFVFILVLGVFQVILYQVFAIDGLRKICPLITHLPLVFLLHFFTRQALWSIISVLTAYLCCQLRRWIALFSIDLFFGNSIQQQVVELIVTLPILFLLLRFVSPSIRNLSKFSFPLQLQFGIIPAISYVFDYVTRIYTNWLAEGIPSVVEFMPFVCSLAYPIFSIYSAQALHRQAELEQIYTGLNLQIKQAEREIKTLQDSQNQTATYRHDLRHHLQYISNCIENSSLDQAQEYIHSLHESITNLPVKQYCKNTAANLIISAFANRAQEAGIAVSVRVHLKESLTVSDNDLCVLLSNALENALNSCIQVKPIQEDAFIRLYCYEKEDRIFLEIINSCKENIPFENDLPVTYAKSHSFGVRSICAVVEKYGGIYHFEVHNQQFVLRLSI